MNKSPRSSRRTKRGGPKGPSSVRSQQSKLLKPKSSYSDGQINTRQIKRLARYYSALYNAVLPVDALEKAFALTGEYFNLLLKHHGVSDGTKRFREARMCVLKWSLGLEIPEVKTLRLQKDGFPSDFHYLKQWANEETLGLVYTILSYPRLASAHKVTFGNLDSVTKHPQRDFLFKKELSEFREALPSLLKGLRISPSNPKKLYENLNFHATSSSGPNSGKTLPDGLISAHLDAIAIINDSNVSWSIKGLSNYIEKPEYFEYIQNLSSEFQEFYSKDLCCSRLAALPQPENKVRIVAIIDYFSQNLLLPLHDYLFEVTRKLPNTYVFDQDKGRELVKSFTSDEEANPQSFDASNFTDRFPWELQECVLEFLTNKEYARWVRHLLINRDFKVPGRKNTVRYGAGQPMGAFSSFPLANLTHSIYAAWKLSSNGEDPWTDSAVVGDDIAFRDISQGSDSYRSGMRHLGVEFSELKGYSSVRKQLRIAEFCKRLYVNGVDKSPISPRLVTKASRDFKFIPALGPHLNEANLSLVIDSVQEKWRDKIRDLIALPPYISGINLQEISASQLSTRFLEKINFLNEKGCNAESVLRQYSIVVLSELLDSEIEQRDKEMKKTINDFFKSSNNVEVAQTLKRWGDSSNGNWPLHDLGHDLVKLASWLTAASNKKGLSLTGSVPHPYVCVAASLLSQSRVRSRTLIEELFSEQGNCSEGPVCTLLSAMSNDSWREVMLGFKSQFIQPGSGSLLETLSLKDAETDRGNKAAMLFAVGNKVLDRFYSYDPDEGPIE